MHRRQYLRATASATVATGALAGTAAANHPSRVPDHVTLSFDRNRLEHYQPQLVVHHLEDFSPTALYAWEASSPEEETDALVYIAHYRGQSGASRADSHYLDREPVIVYVTDAGEIDLVIYAAYHWLANDTGTPAVGTTDGGQHPSFRVAQTYHHYRQVTEPQGELIDVESLGTSTALDADDQNTQYEDWLANGWEDDLRVGALTNPWLMRDRSDFWQDDYGTISFERSLREVWLLLGRKGANRSDL